MFKRKRLSRKHSRRMFSRTAGSQHVHPKNSMGSSGGSLSMRGGIRL